MPVILVFQGIVKENRIHAHELNTPPQISGEQQFVSRELGNENRGYGSWKTGQRNAHHVDFILFFGNKDK